MSKSPRVMNFDRNCAKALSNPPLVVINNQVATLQVGDVLPVVSTGSATVLTTSNTVVNSQIFH